MEYHTIIATLKRLNDLSDVLINCVRYYTSIDRENDADSENVYI